MTSITIHKLAHGYTLRGGEHHGIIAAASTLSEALALAGRHLEPEVRPCAPRYENKIDLSGEPLIPVPPRKLDGSPVVPRYDATRDAWPVHPSEGT